MSPPVVGAVLFAALAVMDLGRPELRRAVAPLLELSDFAGCACQLETWFAEVPVRPGKLSRHSTLSSEGCASDDEESSSSSDTNHSSVSTRASRRGGSK
jgi:hypothetical protein